MGLEPAEKTPRGSYNKASGAQKNSARAKLEFSFILSSQKFVFKISPPPPWKLPLAVVI